MRTLILGYRTSQSGMLALDHCDMLACYMTVLCIVYKRMAVPGGPQAGMMGVMAPGMVPASQVAALPSGVIPMQAVSPPALSATVPSQGMMGHPQQQGIVGAVAQPGMTQVGMMGTMPPTGRIGL